MGSDVGRRVMYRVHTGTDSRASEESGTFMCIATSQDGVGRPTPVAMIEREDGTVTARPVQSFRFADSRRVSVMKVVNRVVDMPDAGVKTIVSREEVVDYKGRLVGFSTEQDDGCMWTSATVVDDTGRVRTAPAYLVQFDQYEVPK